MVTQGGSRALDDTHILPAAAHTIIAGRSKTAPLLGGRYVASTSNMFQYFILTFTIWDMSPDKET